MKVLVTGAAGMLAAEVVPELLNQRHTVIQIDINQRLPEIRKLDVTNFDQVLAFAKKNQPDYIFHLAAETDVDLCERNPDYAFRVNCSGTKNIAIACQKYNITMLYISTAAVFYGDKATPYDEFDTPKPINIYGRSKLEGEVAVENLLSKFFIIRAGWMVGGWDIDKKFVYKIVQQLKADKKELTVVADKFGSPTFTKDFAKNIMNVINTKRYGLYHMANKGTCSRYEIALKILEFMGMDGKVKVNPVDSASFPLFAPRPNSEMLKNHKLELLSLNNMPRWEDSLKEYIEVNSDKSK